MIVKMISQNSTENVEALSQFSETYADRTNTYFCRDLSVTILVVEGLTEHKNNYGTPLCPCRHYDNKEAEVESAYWNCPCVPMRERKECHCMLFLTINNEFSSVFQTFNLKNILRSFQYLS